MKSILLLLLFSTPALGSNLYISSQTGGYIGAGTTGVGYKITKNLSTEGIIGYSIIKGKLSFQFASKNTYSLYKKYKFGLYGGLGIIYIPDDIFRIPVRYPKGYYPPLIFVTTPYFGITYKIKKYKLFFEVVSLCSYPVRCLSRVSPLKTYSLGYSYPINY